MGEHIEESCEAVVRIEFVKTSRLGGWSVGLALCGLAWLTIVAVIQFTPIEGPTLCTFRRVTALPCPTCGASRCALSLLSGRVTDAIAFNPLVFAAGIVVCASMILRTCFARRVRLGLTGRKRLGAWILAGAAVAVNWAYLISAGI